MLKDFELILKELNNGFQRKEVEIMLIKFDLEKAKNEADEYAKKCEELEQKVAELEAEITKLSTTHTFTAKVTKVLNPSQAEIKLTSEPLVLDGLDYEMEGAE